MIPRASALFIAAIFLFAGIDKVFHFSGFVNALRSYVLVPEALVAPLAPVVILAELWVGVTLLRPSRRRQAALASVVVLGVFTTVLVANQLVPPGSVCGCWFTFTLGEGTLADIVRNVILLGLSLTVWSGPQTVARVRESTVLHEAESAPV